MLTRRHLRIKVLQILYAYYQSDDRDIRKSSRELQRSIEKIYELYLYFMLIPGELLNIASREIDQRKTKHRPTDNDLNPNVKFIKNRLFLRLLNNPVLQKQSVKWAVNWEDSRRQGVLKKLYAYIGGCHLYANYMASGNSAFKEDSIFAQNLFVEEIANFEMLHDYFEEESIYWMDDIDLVCAAVLKTIRSVTEDGKASFPLASLHRDEKDENEFVKNLFQKTATGDVENDELIRELAKNWDLDRLAKIDIILLKMALTELTSLSSIPKKVTLNEYIEISKFYSTPKSQMFINGILDKAVVRLENEGKLVKTGRGLID